MTKEDRLDALHNAIYEKQIKIDDLRHEWEEAQKLASTYKDALLKAKDELDDLEEKLSNLEAG